MGKVFGFSWRAQPPAKTFPWWKEMDMTKTTQNIMVNIRGSQADEYDDSTMELYTCLLYTSIASHKYGVYQAPNEGDITWYDFAVEIFRQAGKDTKVIPVSTEEYAKKNPAAASRPKNSRLSRKSLDEAGFSRLPDYKDALARYLKEL